MESIADRAVGSGRVLVVQGDLTRQHVEGVVNAVNEHLQHHGGVAAAILRAGGRLIEEESDQWVREHGPIRPGQAAVTAGGALKAGCVIHVVGPHYRASQDNPGLLAQAATAALDAADKNSLRSIAMPAISAGVFGYPRHDATAVIAAAVSAWLREHEESTLKEVRLVGLDPTTAADFGAALEGT